MIYTMLGLLRFIRWVIAVPFLILLFVAVLVGVPATAVSGIIGRSEAVKQYIKNSGVYENVLDIAVSVMAPKFAAEGGEFFKQWEKRLRDKGSEWGKLAIKVTDPAKLERDAGAVIDAVYAWLEGKTERPKFEIAIVENRDDLIKLLSLAFEDKARGLPKCGADYSPSANFNPLEANCWPAGTDFGAVEQFIQDNADRKEFGELFSKAKFSSASLTISAEATEKARRVFSVVRSIPKIFAAALAGLSLLLLLIVPKFKRALKTVGILLAAPALLLLIARTVLSTQLDSLLALLSQKLPLHGKEMLRGIFENIARALSSDILGKVTLYSLILIAVGILLVFTVRFMKTEKATA